MTHILSPPTSPSPSLPSPNDFHSFSHRFKINTVVNAFNWEEDMSDELEKLAPSRWKVFQVLVLKTENDGGSRYDHHRNDKDKRRWRRRRRRRRREGRSENRRRREI